MSLYAARCYIRFIISHSAEDFTERYESFGDWRCSTSSIARDSASGIFFPELEPAGTRFSLFVPPSLRLSLSPPVSISRRFERETADRRPFNRVVEPPSCEASRSGSLGAICRLGVAIGAGEYSAARLTATRCRCAKHFCRLGRVSLVREALCYANGRTDAQMAAMFETRSRFFSVTKSSRVRVLPRDNRDPPSPSTSTIPGSSRRKSRRSKIFPATKYRY